MYRLNTSLSSTFRRNRGIRHFKVLPSVATETLQVLVGVTANAELETDGAEGMVRIRQWIG
jgi:hypothetical protein